MDVVPDHLHAELAAYALGERIEEMGRLADGGRLDAGNRDGARHRARIRACRRPRSGSGDAARAARIERHLLVLEGLLEQLPADRARRGPGRHRAERQGADRATRRRPNSSNAGGANASDRRRRRWQRRAGTRRPSRCTPTPRPDRTPQPERPRSPSRRPSPHDGHARSRRQDRSRRPARPTCGARRGVRILGLTRSGGHRRRGRGEPLPRPCQGGWLNREAGHVDRPRVVSYRRRLLAFTFASASAPSDPMKKATSSSIGTVTGSPLRPVAGRRIRQRRRVSSAQRRRDHRHGHAVLTVVRRASRSSRWSPCSSGPCEGSSPDSPSSGRSRIRSR